MKPQQLALLKKASDSLQAAQLLANQGYHDFAISRAYYAMFYIAQAFLVGEGLTFSKHSTVISQFGQHFAKMKRVPAKYHRYLIDAQDSRLTGDYDPKSNFTEMDANEIINHAQEFLALAEHLIGPISPAGTDPP